MQYFIGGLMIFSGIFFAATAENNPFAVGLGVFLAGMGSLAMGTLQKKT